MLPSQLAGDRSLAPVMTSHGCEQEGLRKLVEAANPTRTHRRDDSAFNLS